MTQNALELKSAPFAIRITRRREGEAAIIYRRRVTDEGEQKLDKLAVVTPEAFAQATLLFRRAVQSQQPGARLKPGPYYPLDENWGVKVGCFGKACQDLTDPHRLDRTAEHLLNADPNEAAWWLGLMSRHNGHGIRATRAFRILTEATE